VVSNPRRTAGRYREEQDRYAAKYEGGPKSLRCLTVGAYELGRSRSLADGEKIAGRHRRWLAAQTAARHLQPDRRPARFAAVTAALRASRQETGSDETCPPTCPGTAAGTVIRS